MVGGVIIKVVRDATRVAVLVRGTGSEAQDTVGLNLRTGLPLAEGDGIWWQSDKAYWTPKDKSKHDVQMNRVGHTYSRATFETLRWMIQGRT